jgi:hypothetical protein
MAIVASLRPEELWDFRLIYDDPIYAGRVRAPNCDEHRQRFAAAFTLESMNKIVELR